MVSAAGPLSVLPGVVVAATWAALHRTSPAARGWRPSATPTVVAGRLRTRVIGSGSRSLVLLHGIVGCGDYFGAGEPRKVA